MTTAKTKSASTARKSAAKSAAKSTSKATKPAVRKAASKPAASKPAARKAVASKSAEKKKKGPVAAVNKPTSRAKAAPKAAKASTPKLDDGLVNAKKALELALDKKALEPVLLDVSDVCSFCNYQLILSTRSDRQVDAVADSINMGLKAQGVRPLGSEAGRGSQWALLDYGDFVVHIFVHDMREHYDLEGLWSDAKRVTIEVPAEAHLPVTEQYS